MPRLTPCPACHAHVRTSERTCPHCDARLPAGPSRGAIALVGLALAGCPAGASNAPEPEYGVPDTSDPGDPMPEPEPEYGVPDTGEPPPGVDPEPDPYVEEPEYGVVDTSAAELDG